MGSKVPHNPTNMLNRTFNKNAQILKARCCQTASAPTSVGRPVGQSPRIATMNPKDDAYVSLDTQDRELI
ncbi:hypothetical protein EMCG_06042 [[Emmonsia] crescens]|uniref:Uncharacterized protein n=1 Tax=[Emmonsia] crescens TaxID=73230 RepID=A0A0G2JBY4_9EURO|nr:hypothetical protein EMCG_06042 [Emmonsia crescens UAMH 3008]